MKKIILLIGFIFLALPTFAAVTTLEKGTSDEFSFQIGGTEQASITTTGDLSVNGKFISVPDPSANNNIVNKGYVDASFTAQTGMIDYNDCEYLQVCEGGVSAGSMDVQSTTLSCTGTKVLISHSCSGTGNYSPASELVNCYLSAVNSLFVEGINNSGTGESKSCGSIKCCETN